mgnify:CR=1 FL=1
MMIIPRRTLTALLMASMIMLQIMDILTWEYGLRMLQGNMDNNTQKEVYYE